MDAKNAIDGFLKEVPTFACMIGMKADMSPIITWSEMPIETLTYLHKVLGFVIDDVIKQNLKTPTLEKRGPNLGIVKEKGPLPNG